MEHTGPKPTDVRAEYIDVPTVRATIIDVSAKTLYRWAAQDPSMPVLRVAGTVRFHRARLIKWFRQREQGRARND